MFKSKYSKIILILIACLFMLNTAALSQSYDIIIENGKIIDGTGCPWYYGDIGIQGGKIITIGRNLQNTMAARRINATDMFVTPGFIDIHTHNDRAIVNEPWGPLAEAYVKQGVTTFIGGNCGGSKFPIADHLSEVDRLNPSANYAILVGFGTIREEVMGMENRAPTMEELNQMKVLVAKSMEEGAVGMSTGLYYTPDFYATTEEVIELQKVVAEYGGIYTSHIRDESDYNIGLVAAIEEAIAIGEAAGTPVQISHIKCLGTPVWGFSDEVIRIIHEARLRGVNVLADQYSYEASGTSISGALMPPWVKSGPGSSQENFMENIKDPANVERLFQDIQENIVRRGGADTLLLRGSPSGFEFNIRGMYLNEVADKMNVDPVEAAFEIQKAGGASVASFNMSDDDVNNYIVQPFVMVSSDGQYSSTDNLSTHPRAFGNWARALSRFVRDTGLLTWEEAIRKMTSMPANQLGFFDRGLIREGMAADIVVFSPETVKEKATYMDPTKFPEGIPYVLVNGRIVVDKGEHTGVGSGMVLYGTGKK